MNTKTPEERQCSRCGETKLSDCFANKPRVKNCCKTCDTELRKIYNRTEFARLKARINSRIRHARNPDSRKAADKKYRESHREKIALVRLRLDQDKQQSRIILRCAKDTKKITKPSNCQECGSNRKLQAHHKDYNKPLDVTWVCTGCHGKQHRFPETAHIQSVAELRSALTSTAKGGKV